MSTDTVLVTGASADIGLALLARLEKRTALRIAAHCHRSADRLAHLSDTLSDRCMILQADMEDAAQCSALADRLDMASWRPTHLVHLPAMPLVYERFAKFDWQRFQRDMEIQVGSLVRLLKRWLPSAGEPPGLRNVVVVSSSVTLGVPPKYVSMYAAAKYAQLGLLRVLAAEYAERGVMINAVSPSMVDTRFLANISTKAVEISAASNPMRRNATSDEVAGVIEWLMFASPYVNGANVPLTGGS
jgi:3-oxoacyl-[acyl-carrier protein] reductase